MEVNQVNGMSREKVNKVNTKDKEKKIEKALKEDIAIKSDLKVGRDVYYGKVAQETIINLQNDLLVAQNNHETDKIIEIKDKIRNSMKKDNYTNEDAITALRNIKSDFLLSMEIQNQDALELLK